MELVKEIEKSIIKTYRKTIWSKFIKALKDYELIKENDKIMVCISGGKDSFLLAKLIQELQRHGQIHFEAKFVVMNPGYNDTTLEKIKENASILNVPIEIFETDIFSVVDKIASDSPCYLCARMRRGFLYDYASKLGCNKIALGHHFDDVIETSLLSMFYASEIKTMLPILKSDNFEGLELIRPMYLIKEQDIIAWKNYNNLEFINCACKFTLESSKDESKSKRKEMKKLVSDLRKLNKDIDYNFFKSLGNVNLDAILGYRKDKEYHSYISEYKKDKDV